MNPDPVQHPEPKRLAAYAAGRLDDADSEMLERHLIDCPSCPDVMEGFPEDTLVELMRKAETIHGNVPAPEQGWTLPAARTEGRPASPRTSPPTPDTSCSNCWEPAAWGRFTKPSTASCSGRWRSRPSPPR